MDAVKLLGSLLSSGGMGGSVGSNVLGSLLGGGGGGGAAGALGSLLGGGQQQQQQGGGAAGMLGNLLGGGQQQQQGGGIGGALGSLLGAQGGQSGGGGGLLGNVVRGALSQQGGGGGGAAGALGSLLGGGQEQQQQEDPFGGMQQQEVTDQATVLIRAMCNAAKSDGQVDSEEQEKILGRLGDNVGQQEIAFLKEELSQPLDLNGFLQQCPQQMAPQVYAMSVMAINVDTQEEAKYLGQLAQGLGLDGQVCNEIHEQLGAPQIFS